MTKNPIFRVSGWLCALLFGVAGCNRETPPETLGTVKTNAAYQENFGAPPTTDKGSCLARVGYLPVRDQPGKVRALPLFLFRESDQLLQLLNRLTDGELTFPPDSPFINPFPPGSKVLIRDARSSGPEIDLQPAAPIDPALLPVMTAALAETALQFERYQQVRILVQGRPAQAADDGWVRHQPGRIAAAAAPVLLTLVGTWEPGSDGPREILADFDRPVDILDFRLLDSRGVEVAGPAFHSVFDMAVVVQPAQAGTLREGEMFTVVWQVRDRLGRENRGTDRLSLRRHDRP